MASSVVWRDIYTPLSVLDNEPLVIAEKFTSEDIEQLTECSSIIELELHRSLGDEPIDLSKIAHIHTLRSLELDRVKYINLGALRALPKLRSLIIERCEISDFSEIDGFEVLEYLNLSRCKLKEIPKDLHLPKLDAFTANGNKLTDVSFLLSFPLLEDVSLGDNKIVDISPLAMCSRLKKINLDFNPITDLSPLKGLSLLTSVCYVEEDRFKAMLEEAGITLAKSPPYRPSQDEIDSIQARNMILNKINDGDWEYFYSLRASKELGQAVYRLLDDMRVADETIRNLFQHPDPDIFELIIMNGIELDHTHAIKRFYAIASEYGDALVGPLENGFRAALESAGRGRMGLWGFGIGRLKDPQHTRILGLIKMVASPAFANLFMMFYAERHNFSSMHSFAYHILCPIAGKTKAHELAAPMIDILRLDKKSVGGDTGLLMKCLKGISELGNEGDIPLLESTFDIHNETRDKVREAYEKAVAKMLKRKLNGIDIEESV